MSPEVNQNVRSTSDTPRHLGPSVSLFAPSTSVTVTVESDAVGSDDIHFHAGGQGIWVARTIVRLGESPVLCTPLGGEAGLVLEALVRRDGIGLLPIRVNRATPAYIHDRRSGDRQIVAENGPKPLTRHEVDDLYESVLASALGTNVIVVTGRPQTSVISDSFYRRLGSDLARAGVRVIGDLHGSELDAFLENGAIHMLKVSEEDLRSDGHSIEDDRAAFRLLRTFQERGVEGVVLTRGAGPSLCVIGDERFSIVTPSVASADHRGSGDAMTGALTVGIMRGLTGADLLKLGSGAGAASATRHGLATANAVLIAEFADRVDVTSLA